MKKNNLISIVIPAKDEEKNISPLIKKLRREINSKKLSQYNFEIIVVCDNCKDRTEEIAKSLGVKTIRREGKPSKSKALVDGFKFSKGEILVMMDADLSHLPEELPGMINKLESNKKTGLVIASRNMGKSDDVTFMRHLGGVFLNECANFFFGTKLTDAINGYKIFRRHIFDNYSYNSNGFAIEIELIANTLRAGANVEEIPSYEPPRASGEVKSRLIKDGWIFFKEIITEGIGYNTEKINEYINKRSEK